MYICWPYLVSRAFRSNFAPYPNIESKEVLDPVASYVVAMQVHYIGTSCLSRLRVRIGVEVDYFALRRPSGYSELETPAY